MSQQHVEVEFLKLFHYIYWTERKIPLRPNKLEKLATNQGQSEEESDPITATKLMTLTNYNVRNLSVNLFRVLNDYFEFTLKVTSCNVM